MIRVPGMLMVGAAGRNAGKTELACSLIERFAGQHEVVAVKVTTVRKADGTCPRGGRGCGVCSSLDGPYCITEETAPPPDKDTARLLAAGAARVYWVRVLRASLEDALAALAELIPPGAVCVCESNSMRLVAEPDLFLITKEKGSAQNKESAQDVMHLADRVVSSDGPGLELDDVDIVDGEWALRAEAAAVIMAGGKSTRMGRDKAMLSVHGRPLVEHVRDRLRPHFKEILVSAAAEDDYAFLGERVVADELPGQGPLMGIASALEACRHETAFVVACDMPEVDTALARRLLREARGHDGAVPVSGGVGGDRYEPLFAVYNRSFLGGAREALEAGERSIRAAFGRCDMRSVEMNFPEGGGLRNINTENEYEEFRKEESRRENLGKRS